MHTLPRFSRTLSFRISLKLMLAMAMLMSAALFVMLFFARRGLKTEALHKADQTLSTLVLKTDNQLFGVEQSAGNAYFDILKHLDRPDRMLFYCEELVKANSYVDGCAIAFEPYYYPERGQYFMTYVRRDEAGQLIHSYSPVVMPETYGNVPYTEQVWYTKPIAARQPMWMLSPPMSSGHGEAVVTFCLPIYAGQATVGVLGIDISLKMLSNIVLQAKPSPNSYATMLDSDGTFIIHPDTTKLFHNNATEQKGPIDPSVREAVEAMLSGKNGYKEFRLNGQDCYVFFRPFERAITPGRVRQDLGWSVGIIYPKDDIFGDYNALPLYTLIIAIVGFLLLTALCQWFISRQLRPLRMLTQSVQRISEGHYDEPIPDSRQQDEVGRLQDHFQRMQQSLAAHMGSLEALTTQLQQQGEVLAAAYEQAQKADSVKTTFLHNMSDQMLAPVQTIADNVEMMCKHGAELSPEEVQRLVSDIQHQGKAVTDTLDDLLALSDREQP